MATPCSFQNTIPVAVGSDRLPWRHHAGPGIPRGCVSVYLVGPDEGLHSQVILHQLLHVGLSPHQGGQLGGRRQAQRRLVGGARRSARVGVPEKHVPGLTEGGDRSKGQSSSGRLFRVYRRFELLFWSPQQHHPSPWKQGHNTGLPREGCVC